MEGKHRTLEEAMEQLPAREQYILRQRFGFDDKPCTLQEVACAQGVTRERVRQLEKCGLVLLLMYLLKQDERAEQWRDYYSGLRARRPAGGG